MGVTSLFTLHLMWTEHRDVLLSITDITCWVAHSMLLNSRININITFAHHNKMLSYALLSFKIWSLIYLSNASVYKYSTPRRHPGLLKVVYLASEH